MGESHQAAGALVPTSYLLDMVLGEGGNEGQNAFVERPATQWATQVARAKDWPSPRN